MLFCKSRWWFVTSQRDLNVERNIIIRTSRGLLRNRKTEFLVKQLRPNIADPMSPFVSEYNLVHIPRLHRLMLPHSSAWTSLRRPRTAPGADHWTAIHLRMLDLLSHIQNTLQYDVVQRRYRPSDRKKSNLSFRLKYPFWGT